MNDIQEPVLICKDLCISYYTRAGEIPAVVDFSLTVKPGETIGIVGSQAVANQLLPWQSCSTWVPTAVSKADP